MRILTIVQGIYGQRITANIRHGEIPGWIVESWQLPLVLPPVIDYPEDFLPATLPPADLVIALGEHPGAAELLPDILRLCGGQAAIVPVDNGAWLPPGLANQLARWLADMGVAAVFPKPFCSLTESTCNTYRQRVAYDVPLVTEFARHFGRPSFQMDWGADRTTIETVSVVRDSPCGCAHHVAQGLAGVAVEEAEHASGMLHHHYPCLAGMAIDATYNDSLMHVSGHILRDEVAGLVKPYKRLPAYLRPGRLSSDDRQR
jgi:hypothetical protein